MVHYDTKWQLYLISVVFRNYTITDCILSPSRKRKYIFITVVESSRVSVADGKPLPDARAVSLLIFQERELLSPAVTLMHMTFGQLLDHDIGRTAVAKLAVTDSRTGNSIVKFIDSIPLNRW